MGKAAAVAFVYIRNSILYSDFCHSLPKIRPTVRPRTSTMMLYEILKEVIVLRRLQRAFGGTSLNFLNVVESDLVELCTVGVVHNLTHESPFDHTASGKLFLYI